MSALHHPHPAAGRPAPATPALAELAEAPAAFAAPERVPGLSLADLSWFTDRAEAEQWAAEIRRTPATRNGPAVPLPPPAPPETLPDPLQAEISPQNALLPWFLALALGEGSLGDLVPPGAPEHETIAEAARLCAETTARTVVLHLHLSLHGVGEDRFPDRQAALLAELRTPEGIARLLAEYPRLEPYCRAVASGWADARRELLDRLAADRPLLSDTFGIAAETDVASLSGALGDRHNRGRTTHRITFADGTVLMYKPRPAGVDQWWADLCSLLRERGAADVHCARTLDRGTYGWQEFLRNSEEADPARYYRNLGALAAVTTLICSIDLHYENIVAVGDRPAVIDCETLLTAALTPPHDGNGDGTYPPDASAISDSVANLLILPGFDPSARNAEISALAGGIEPANLQTRQLVDNGRGPRYEMRDFELPAHGTNAPRGTRDRNSVAGYEQDFVEGYRTAYRGVVAMWRQGGLARLIDRAESVTLRYVPRPTRTYGAKLNGSTHPNVLRDPLGPDIVLSSLWTTVKTYPALARLMAHEHADLANGDIPYFRHSGGSRDVHCTDGTVIRDYFADDAAGRLRRRLERAGEADLAFQCTVIGLSFACERARGTTAGTPVNSFETAAPAAPADAPTTRPRSDRAAGAQLLNWSDAAERRLAARVADRIRHCVYSRDGEFLTLGTTVREPLRWIMHSPGPALYDGLSGIAVALAELGAAYDLPEHRGFALEVQASSARQVLRNATPSHGAHGGAGGVLWAETVLAARHGAPLGSAAEGLLDLVERAPDGTMDVVSGAAGTVLAATGTLDLLPQAQWAQRLRAAAATAAEMLRSHAQVDGTGAHWPMAPNDTSLIGFAHGSAGALYALARAGEHGLARAADTDLAADTFRWDDAHRRGGVWPDLRAADDDTTTMAAWCHGAPGIALARAAWPLADGGPGLGAALDLLRNSEPGESLNLCHGLLGNALIAARLRHRGATGDEMVADADARVRRVIGDRGGPDAVMAGPQPEFETGMAPSVHLPGLMTGVGGLAYWLAATRDPSVPDVLTLET
ncbi:hypothetical protein GCM10027570_51950 [Streptomonospora sediminis]